MMASTPTARIPWRANNSEAAVRIRSRGGSGRDVAFAASAPGWAPRPGAALPTGTAYAAPDEASPVIVFTLGHVENGADQHWLCAPEPIPLVEVTQPLREPHGDQTPTDRVAQGIWNAVSMPSARSDLPEAGSRAPHAKRRLGPNVQDLRVVVRRIRLLQRCRHNNSGHPGAPVRRSDVRPEPGGR